MINGYGFWLDKKIFLIADHLRVHYSKVVSGHLTENATFVEFFYPSSCSPYERLNCAMKNDLGKKSESKRKGELAGNAKTLMESIQKKSQTVKNLVKKDTVCYAG